MKTWHYEKPYDISGLSRFSQLTRFTPLNNNQSAIDNSPINGGSNIIENNVSASAGDRISAKLFSRYQNPAI